jgi:hypothetical protein
MKKFCLLLMKIKLALYLLFGLPLVASLVWLVAGNFIPLPFYLSVSQLHMVIFLFSELLLLTIMVHLLCKTPEKSRKDVIWLLIFIFSLVNLVLVLLLRGFYSRPAFSGYGSVQTALKFAVSIIVFLSLVLVFSLIRMIIQVRKISSDKPEAKHSLYIGIWKNLKNSWEQFWKVPSPGNRKFTIFFLAICFVIGLALRLINLGQLPPYVDEYAHTHAAYQLLTEGTFGYSRAFLTITLPVFLSMKVFGQSLWAARFPMVLLNMAAIVPLYAFTKKMNKKVGFISVLLFILSPWIIGVSKTIREYAVAPLFFFTIGYLLIDLLDWEKYSAKQYLKKHWLRAAILLILLIYTLIDRRSVLIINFAIYAVFGLFAILKLLKQKTSKWLNWAVIFGGLASFVLLLYRSGFLRRLIQDPSSFFRWNNRYVSVIFDGPNQQWYALGFWGYIVVGFGALIALRTIFRKYHKADTVAGFSFLTFIVFVVGLAIRIPRGGFRYGALPEYWYLVVVAIFLYGIYFLLQRIIKRNWLAFLLWTLIFLGFFTNYQGIYKAVSYTGGRSSPVTGETHSIVEPALDFLAKNISENDILLMDTVKRYGEIVGKELPDIEIINVNNIRRDETVSAIDYVLDYPSGWIAVTPHALSWIPDIPREETFVDGRLLSYIGTIGNVFVWHWTTP